MPADVLLRLDARIIVRCVVLLALLAPVMLSAQTEVHVIGPIAQPIFGARVDLWNETAIVASRHTNDAGVAQFSATEMAAASAVLVRRIGFLPTRVSVPQPVGRIEVLLDALAGSLPAVTVNAVATKCPHVGDSSAAVLWRTAATRYRVPSLEGRVSRMEQATAVVVEAAVGEFDGAPRIDGWREYTRLGMEGAHARLSARRYVTPLQDNHQHEMFGLWAYPALDAELAGHFVTPGFGEAHSFERVSVGPAFVVLRFCARDRRRPGLDGTLRLDSTNALLDARWRYWNPLRHSEEAGGEVVFVPPARDLFAQPLLSASGLFWRRLPSGRYAQRWQQYSAWRLEAGGEIVR